MAQDILSDLVEDACLGLCFEVHRAVKQGYFFLDDTDQESMRDFGEHNLFYLAKRLYYIAEEKQKNKNLNLSNKLTFR